MKRVYVSPEMEKIIFEVTDIITLSVATGSGNEDLGFGDLSKEDEKPGKQKNSIVFDGNNVYVFGIKG